MIITDVEDIKQEETRSSWIPYPLGSFSKFIAYKKKMVMLPFTSCLLI